MSDIKLFRLGAGVSEVVGAAADIEKSLQTLIEQNMEPFLGVRFLASEHSTGKSHAGRIDSLGIDEDGSPVIVEYKRSINENVINQGLFYLDWLLDHRGDFEMLALKRFGKQVEVDWNHPRLICIAGDFTKYDEHAVQQINRNIELLRYKRFGNDLLMLELVNRASSGSAPAPQTGAKSYGNKTIEERLAAADAQTRDTFESLKAYILSLGDDVQAKTLKDYFAFRRIKNFACVEVHPQAKKVVVYVKLDPDSLTLEPGFARDVRKIGHFGTGDLELTIHSPADLAKVQNLVSQSYQLS